MCYDARTVPTRSPSSVLRELASRYCEQLRAALPDRLVAVVLFGSVARGQAGPASDIDLLIVAEGLPAGQFARKRLLAEVDAEFDRTLFAAEAEGIETRLARIVLTPAEAARVRPLYLDLTEDAVLLHDRDGFFAGVLGRVRSSLAQLGSRRIRTGRTWYWDLKPGAQPGERIEV